MLAMLGSSWPFAKVPKDMNHSSKLGMHTINRIIYGHSLHEGSGAGARGHGNSRSVIRRYRGGLVQQLAYGGGDKHGREFNHYASSQNNTGSGVI
ncbi:hypothetical protein T484DRAFT_1880335 [Baffinella frigidus]|nr:hypothetical protein T484DRAFT_1880335 [Cryptophyta sp. CCMP2293]